MVVTRAPSSWTARSRQLRALRPSTSTVQAPQTPCSQPTWVPVSPRSSRRKSASERRASTSRSTAAPLTVSRTRSALGRRRAGRHAREAPDRRAQRVLGQHGGEVAPVLGRGVDVVGRIAVAAARRRPRGPASPRRAAPPPASASAARRRTGRSADAEAHHARVTARARRARPPTPASAKSPGRRAISTKPQPRGAAGTRTSVEQLVGRERGGEQAAEEVGGRDPAHARAAPAGRAWRRARASAAGSSAAGSAWARLPPSVPRLRIAVWPTWRAASARSGARSRTSGAAARSAWRTSAPSTSPPSRRGVDPLELARAVEVDEHRRADQAHVEQRHEALAAREQLRLAPARREQGDRLRGGGGTSVAEGSGLHRDGIMPRRPARRRPRPRCRRAPGAGSGRPPGRAEPAR